MSKQIQVAVAVIENSLGEILLTRRANDKHQGGLWEFPGGKCEPDEQVRQTLTREIHEELGIEIQEAEPLISIPYQYPELRVLLDVFRVTTYSGQPRGAEGQPMQWVRPEQLDTIPLPPANRPIVRALQLPDRYLITPDSPDIEFLFQGAQRAAACGIQLIQLRAPQLPKTDYLALADRLLDSLPTTSRLLIKGSLEDMLQRPRAGWHLTASQLGELAGQARPLPDNRLLAASCHDAAQLQQAAALLCDFATLSPVLPTSSHPDGVALGMKHATELTATAQVPVYWLGGMQLSHLPCSRQLGAQGIAAIRGLWPAV